MNLTQKQWYALTERQRIVYGYIREQLKLTGVPPTVSEIGSNLAMRTEFTRSIIMSLEERGLVKSGSAAAGPIQLSDALPIQKVHVTKPLVTLTPQQRAIYRYIRKRIKATGETPAVGEVAVNCKIRSTETVMSHIDVLEEKGLIKKGATTVGFIQLPDFQATSTPPAFHSGPSIGLSTMPTPVRSESVQRLDEPTNADDHRPGAKSPDWLRDLPEDGVRKLFGRLAEYGVVTETEAIDILGSGRKLRQFSSQLESYAAHAPFNVHVAFVAGVKRYVRQGNKQ